MNLAPKLKERIPLFLILLLSAFLNMYNIWTDEYANTYYTTAVASMLHNFHNFFFASLDPAGSVTVDKPPVVFWIQTASAYLFGLHGWSVILPQALAGVGSVLLLYRLVKPTFGLAAVRISALAMACTPIAAAVSRTNNIDSMLVFTLLLSTWLLFRGIQRNSIWSLLGAFSMIGVAFNMKMLQAYMVLPAFYLFYLVAAKASWKKKIALLSSATAVMLAISVSWAVVVDSIPKDQRPYISSSQTNSVLELAFGYNGVSRLTGNQGPGGGGGMPGRNGGGSVAASRNSAINEDGGGTMFDRNDGGGTASKQANDAAAVDGGNRLDTTATPNGNGNSGQYNSTIPGGDQGQPPTMNGNGGPGAPGGFGGGGGAFGTGQKGPLRLFQSELSGQASWLIPFAGISIIAIFAGWRRRNFTPKHKETLFWLAWLLPAMVFFSIAGFFHHYYLIMLAPPIAALVGAGWKQLWDAYRLRQGWKTWLLPAAIFATSIFEWYIMHPYDDVIGSVWSAGIAAGGIIISLLLLLWKRKHNKLARTLALAGMLVLFVGPLYWAATPITYGLNSMLPQAGPGIANGRGGVATEMGPGRTAAMGEASDTKRTPTMGTGGPGMESQQIDETTLKFLRSHNTGTYLFATSDYSTAAPYIIKSGESVSPWAVFQAQIRSIRSRSWKLW
ncbi:glycosyltransferase family 39 protein [Paenibacillus piri]|uniref:glycosyltransferase family 39 protein n=1 Tax=Paenibacillus piri TaxID=2547395 RepID=UPI0026ACAAA3